MQQSVGHVFMSPALQGRVNEKETQVFSRIATIYSSTSGFKFCGCYANLCLAHKHLSLYGELGNDFPTWLFDAIGSSIHVSIATTPDSTVDRFLKLTQVQLDVNEGTWMIIGEILIDEEQDETI